MTERIQEFLRNRRSEDQDTEPSSNAPTPPTEQADTSSTELHGEGNEG